MNYDLLRGLHLVAVIAWMAGMLLLPRLYAYQTEAAPGGELEAKMVTAAQRLRTLILTPALLATWALGLALWIGFHPGAPPLWLTLKLLAVLALSGLHGFFVAAGRRLAKGERRHSARFWRIMNEVPFVIAIAAVLLVTLQQPA